jgi:hypothetical protein
MVSTRRTYLQGSAEYRLPPYIGKILQCSLVRTFFRLLTPMGYSECGRTAAA